MTLMALVEAFNYLTIALGIGLFAYWLVAYFLLEVVRHFRTGPSRQLRSLGTSVLDQKDQRPLQSPVLSIKSGKAEDAPPLKKAA